MGYIDNSLSPDEKIVYRTKKHVIIFMVPVVFLLFTCLLCTEIHFVAMMNNTFFMVTRQFPYLEHIHRLPALFMLLLTAYSGMQQWLIYTTSDYVVTNRRVVMKEGFFARFTSDSRLATVSHVTVDQNLLAQLWNYGTLTINGFGGNQDRFVQVANPSAFQRAVQTQLDMKDA